MDTTDDINKVIVGLISSGRIKEPKDAIIWYVKKYFETDKAEKWANWFCQWGIPSAVNLEKAYSDFIYLKNNTQNNQSWRIKHWESKLKLYQLNEKIMGRKRWDKERIKLVEAYFSEWENLCRNIYRLGPIRHILTPKFWTPSWFNSWMKIKNLKTFDLSVHKEA